MPEQGTTVGYNLSCFPNIWQDTVVLGNDIKKIWNELLAEWLFRIPHFFAKNLCGTGRMTTLGGKRSPKTETYPP